MQGEVRIEKLSKTYQTRQRRGLFKSGSLGKIIETTDEEDGERVEIFVE